jgi:protein TonB
MAAQLAKDQSTHTDTMLAASLLLSLALHAGLALLPGAFKEPDKIVDLLTVELQPPPPKPLPPPEPPKPEPEKPKEPPKKPPQPPKALPLKRSESPPPEPVRETPPPSVIAAAPKPSEPAATFVAPPAPPPDPPKAKVPTDQEIDAARGNYGSLLAREFAKHKQYPRIAQLRGWQGMTKIELHIDASGNVTSSIVSESSSFEILDKQALEMVRKASPLPLPPETLRGREFTIVIPVAFRLE